MSCQDPLPFGATIGNVVVLKNGSRWTALVVHSVMFKLNQLHEYNLAAFKTLVAICHDPQDTHFQELARSYFSTFDRLHFLGHDRKVLPQVRDIVVSAVNSRFEIISPISSYA